MTEKITDDGNDRSMIIMMEILVILLHQSIRMLIKMCMVVNKFLFGIFFFFLNIH